MALLRRDPAPRWPAVPLLTLTLALMLAPAPGWAAGPVALEGMVLQASPPEGACRSLEDLRSSDRDELRPLQAALDRPASAGPASQRLAELGVMGARVLAAWLRGGRKDVGEEVLKRAALAVLRCAPPEEAVSAYAQLRLDSQPTMDALQLRLPAFTTEQLASMRGVVAERGLEELWIRVLAGSRVAPSALAAPPEEAAEVAACDEVLFLLTFSEERRLFEDAVRGVGLRLRAGHPSGETWARILAELVLSWRIDLEKPQFKAIDLLVEHFPAVAGPALEGLIARRDADELQVRMVDQLERRYRRDQLERDYVRDQLDAAGWIDRCAHRCGDRAKERAADLLD